MIEMDTLWCRKHVFGGISVPDARVFVILYFLAVGTQAVAQTRPEKQFFNRRDLKGWWAGDMKYWSARDGVIEGRATGKVERNQFLWSNVKVADFYLSVDVLLDPNDRNAGIQFRSRKADETGQAVGYQADAGKGVWGRLYHEHDRGMLDWSARGEKAVNPGQWNKYEILAVGDRIWTAINGKLAVSVIDAGGDASGFIAFQIHAGEPQIVRYKINQLIHNPKVTLAGLSEAALNKELKLPLNKPLGDKQWQPLKFNNNDVVVLAGGTNISEMRKDGYLETLLLASHPNLKLDVLNMGWDGDTAYERFRDVGITKWSDNLDSLGADVVLMQFGQMESLDGELAIPDFVKNYRKLIDETKSTGRNIGLISPIPFEPKNLNAGEGDLGVNPLEGKNLIVEKYAMAVKSLALELGYPYVDLYNPLLQAPEAGLFTSDGMHLSGKGQKYVASLIVKQLNLKIIYASKMEPLRQAILQKNILWMEYWRPANWAFLGGDRAAVTFSYDWKNTQQRTFPEEMKAFGPLIREAEDKITEQQKSLHTPIN